MIKYIPFIHKLPKKEKFVPMQLPLYIEPYPILEKQKDENEEKTVIIYELY